MSTTTMLRAPRSAVSGLTERLGYTGGWILAAAVLVVVGTPIVEARNLWPFVVTGISDGAVYALAALGLVLTFKTSGIFNFAVGAQAAASAYVFYSLRVDGGMPWPVAFGLSLFLVGIVGSLLLERMAFWLEEAPAVMRVVATIGLIVGLVSILTAAYGDETLRLPPYLSQDAVTVAGTQILMSQIIVTVLALVATIGLGLFFRRARMGLAMQALVDDPDLLASQGTSPTTVRRFAWAIGSCFVSISGMLVGPVLGVDVNLMLLLYIAAFGAAALGAFDNLTVTFIAALMIGIATNVASLELAGFDNVYVNRLYTQVPFLALIAALLFVPRARLIERGGRRVRKFAPVRPLPSRVALPTVLGAGTAFVALPHLVPEVDLNQFTYGLGFVIVLMSLSLLLWSSGQISLCQMAFAAVGATTFAHLQSRDVPWLLCLLFAGLAAVPAGAIVAIPSFRLSGVYLAVATFGFGLLAQNLLYESALMFDTDGAASIDRPELFGADTAGDKGYYYVVLAVTVLVAGLVLLVRGSRLGRILRSLADSPAALEAHAVRINQTRVVVFCLSAFIAAVGGALIAGVARGASSNVGGPFGYLNSLALVAVLVFCGRRPILGPVVAAALYAVVNIYPPMDTAFFTDYRGAMFGGLAIAVAVLPGVRLPQLHGRGAERAAGSRAAERVERAASARILAGASR